MKTATRAVTESQKLKKALALLAEMRFQSCVMDAAWDDAGFRRWIRKVEHLLGEEAVQRAREAYATPKHDFEQAVRP